MLLRTTNTKVCLRRYRPAQSLSHRMHLPRSLIVYMCVCARVCHCVCICELVFAYAGIHTSSGMRTRTRHTHTHIHTHTCLSKSSTVADAPCIVCFMWSRVCVCLCVHLWCIRARTCFLMLFCFKARVSHPHHIRNSREGGSWIIHGAFSVNYQNVDPPPSVN